MQRRAGVPEGARKIRQQGSTFYVTGDERHPVRDAYHTFLQLSWLPSLGVIFAFFLLANVLFACAYRLAGGVEKVHSFFDALSFSVQTMATVGYGEMHPQSVASTIVMMFESFLGILLVAVLTGLVFSKFSRPTTRVAFSKFACVTTHDGKRTLMLRVGNRRSNIIVEATVHLVAFVTTTTQEGDLFYKATDLKLVRDRQVGMARGWTILHVIDEDSPLHEMDQESAKRAELEIYMSLTGIDSTSKQTVHATHQFTDGEIRFGHRFVDTLIPLGGDEYVLDLRNFDATVPDTTPRDSVRA